MTCVEDIRGRTESTRAGRVDRTVALKMIRGESDDHGVKLLDFGLARPIAGRSLRPAADPGEDRWLCNSEQLLGRVRH